MQNSSTRKISFFLILFTLFVLIDIISSQNAPPPNKKVFNQKLDHFNPQNLETFTQRYFVYDKDYNPKNDTISTIFFYCGGEGDIEEFWNNTGMPFDIAKQFNAYIIFAEHRYYGKSFPQNNISKNDVSYFKYLSMEQAIADFASIIQYIKTNTIHLNLKTAAVIAWGGSYGGILSALLRIHYPSLFQIAVSASAPWYGLMNLANPSIYFEIVTNDYKNISEQCPQIVRDGFTEMYDKYVNTNNYKPLQSIFNTCSSVNKSNFRNFMNWIRNAFATFAQSDYPYSTSMFGKGMPAWPVSVVCQDILLQNKQQPLNAISITTQYYYNNISNGGNLKCLNVTQLFPNCSDSCWCGTGKSALSWNYQQCTEIIIPTDTNNETDMFPPDIWELSNLTTFCQDRFNVTPQPTWDEIWEPKDIDKIGKYIIWSNGELDPWGGGGFKTNFTNNNDMVVFLIPDGAHHYDLRFANVNDTKYVINVRKQEIGYLWKWLTELGYYSV